jgi:hypothetical protein
MCSSGALRTRKAATVPTGDGHGIRIEPAAVPAEAHFDGLLAPRGRDRDDAADDADRCADRSRSGIAATAPR